MKHASWITRATFFEIAVYSSSDNIWMPYQMPVQNKIVPKVELYLNDNDLLQVNEITTQKINLNMSVHQIVV